MEANLNVGSALEVKDLMLPHVKGLTQNRLLQHVLFWLLSITFFSLLYGSYIDDYYNGLMIELFELPFKMSLVYINMYYLMPQYLLQKRYLEFFVYLLLLMIGTVALMQYVLLPFLVHPMLFPTTCTKDNLTVSRFVKNTVNMNYLVTVTAMIALFKSWYRNQHMAQSLAKDKLEAELQVLKGQVHPHFLFNTLNSLYSLTLKKSERAPEVVLKLSALMDYMLYDAAAAKVPLEKEVNYIRNYIELERMRYGDRLDLRFTESGDMTGRRIAPMILLAFIENAFKHGVSNENDDAWVCIDLKVEDGLLTLEVENSKSKEVIKRSSRDYASGIGLKNVCRRLELLYEGCYTLDMQDQDNVYTVRLELELCDN